MLYHLEPSVEMTGGPWYTDNELDTFSSTPYLSSLPILESWHCIVISAFNLYLIQMLDNVMLELDCSLLAMQVAETYWHLG